MIREYIRAALERGRYELIDVLSRITARARSCLPRGRRGRRLRNADATSRMFWMAGLVEAAAWTDHSQTRKFLGTTMWWWANDSRRGRVVAVEE